MQLQLAISDRRAVRDYTDQPVSEAIVESLIKAATMAPSAMNEQPWAFVVIQDKALLKQYSDRAKVLCTETVGLGSAHEKMGEMLSNPSFNIFYDSGTLIVIWAKPIGQHPDWDCCLAAQNLMLAAHDMGLGSCPIGLAWPLFGQAVVKSEINVPRDYSAVMPIIVGYPHGEVTGIERKEAEILCWR